MADTPTRSKAFRPRAALALALGVLGAALSPLPAAAAAAPEPLTWDRVAVVARGAFDAGPGRAFFARAQGDRAAAEAVPGDLESVDLSSRWDRDFSGPAGTEVTVDALVVWRLGHVAAARRDAWRADAEARDAATDVARFSFTLEALQRFVRWWERQALAAHVQEHLVEQAHFLEPARAAAEKQLVSRLVLSDLEVEVARLEVEATAMRGAADVAARELVALLGTDAAPSDAGLDAIDTLREAPANPWRAVADQLARHPELRALEAEAAAARARGEAAAADGPARLHLGAGFRRTDGESSWGALLVGVSVPLGNPSGDAAERERADALAADAARAWRLRTLAAEVDTYAAQYDAAAARLTRIQTALVGPMGERVLLFERAVLAGRADLEQLVRARRDLLEAHHDLVHAAAELLGHRAHARAMTSLLEGAPQ